MQNRTVKWMPVVRRMAFLAMGAAVFFSGGCASRQAAQTGQLLAAAGFDMKLARTPEQVEHLEKLPQDQITRHEGNGNPFYVYADAKGCRCIYVGGPTAYKRYRQLLQEKEIAGRRGRAAQEAQDVGMYWGHWGGPWNLR